MVIGIKLKTKVDREDRDCFDVLLTISTTTGYYHAENLRTEYLKSEDGQKRMP
jgi:hypothetical protein